MRLIKTRRTYWSCTDFAHVVLSKFNIDKPTSASMTGWDEWKDHAIDVNKFIYWLVEEQFDNVQDVIYFPYDVFNTIRIYVRNRFIDRVHLLDTKLSRGEWYDRDTLLMHGMFELLVDFVELEKANMWFNSHSDEIVPFQFNHSWAKWFSQRSEEAGLKYLDWEMSLIDEDTNELTHQASAAKEIVEIYHWWKNIRPIRIDPMDISGWSKWCESHPNFLTTNEDRPTVKQLLNNTTIIEEAYDKEDEEMMMRLIKVRKSLWT